MKKKTNIMIFLQSLAIVMIVLLSVSLGHTSQEMKDNDRTNMEEVQKEMDNALTAIKEYSADKKDEAMAEAEKILNRMDARIDDLEEKSVEQWQKMSEASREKKRQAMRELRRQRNEIAEWYGGMKQSSAGAWKEMKKGFADSYDSLKQAFDKAAEEF